MLIYYYLLNLLFTVSDLSADKVDWRRHLEPQKHRLTVGGQRQKTRRLLLADT